MREKWEMPADCQKHLIIGRIIDLKRNAEDKTISLNICVEERRIINNEEVITYEQFLVIATLLQEIEIGKKLCLGAKVECRYFTFEGKNICNYIMIVDKDFIPAELKEQSKRLKAGIKQQDKQERKKIYDFES